MIKQCKTQQGKLFMELLLYSKGRAVI